MITVLQNSESTEKFKYIISELDEDNNLCIIGADESDAFELSGVYNIDDFEVGESYETEYINIWTGNKATYTVTRLK